VIMKGNKFLVFLFAIAIYLISTGIGYFIFTVSGASQNGGAETVVNNSTGKTGNDYQAMEFDQSASKTEVCPLNGIKYSTEQRDWWGKHRPLGVMIENHEEARPQSGVNAADVTYEAVAEGGITRTLNVYYCQDAGIIGPVRSARVYFLDFIAEYGSFPLYAHVGGANTPGPADALGQLADMDWVGYNDLNQFSLGLPTFWRDESRLGHQVATEHTMYSTTSKLWAIGEKRGLTNVDKNGKKWDASFVPYVFKDDAPSSSTQKIHIEYWKGYASYFVDWTYNKKNNNYLRNNAGKPHMDRNTNEQLQAKNIVVLFMQESNAYDGYENNLHLLYKTKGSGKALVYMDGKEIKATWQKSSRTGRTELFATDGSEINFNRGKIWFHIIPLEGVVETV
jgi:hypothetical protein